MKKIITMTAALLALLTLASCAAKQPPAAEPVEPPEPEPQSQTEPEEQNAPLALSDGEIASGNGVAYCGKNITEVIELLGGDYEYEESQSCAYDGLDKVFIYDGLEIYTFPNGENDYIDILTLTSDAYATSRGISPGDTAVDVAKAYGDGFETAGKLMVYEFADFTLNFYISNGSVGYIEYVRKTKTAADAPEPQTEAETPAAAPEAGLEATVSSNMEMTLSAPKSYLGANGGAVNITPITTSDAALDATLDAILGNLCDESMTLEEMMLAAYSWAGKAINYRTMSLDTSGGISQSMAVEQCLYALETRRGECDHYAILTACLFNRLGVETRYIIGSRYNTVDHVWGNHTWIQASFRGVWYHFDTLFQRSYWYDCFMATDDDILYHHRWGDMELPVYNYEPEETETPAETPVETPVETPAETPTETPAETPAETPVETPAETPVETPVETPDETPAETPLETPVETPAETPVETPVKTPAETPIETPDETPAETAAETENEEIQ